MLSQTADKLDKTGYLIPENSKKTAKDNDPYSFGSFIFGCLLIPFALVLLWKNEKKVVTFSKCMD